jgi:hypothetical protein
VNLLAVSPDDTVQHINSFGLVRLLFRWATDHYTVRLNVTGLCLVQISALRPDVLRSLVNFVDPFKQCWNSASNWSMTGSFHICWNSFSINHMTWVSCRDFKWTKNKTNGWKWAVTVQ